MASVHEHIRRVHHVSNHDELPAGVDDLGLLGVRPEVEVVPALRGRIGGPVGDEGGVLHARHRLLLGHAFSFGAAEDGVR